MQFEKILENTLENNKSQTLHKDQNKVLTKMLQKEKDLLNQYMQVARSSNDTQKVKLLQEKISKNNQNEQKLIRTKVKTLSF
jgi:Zn-dependent M32 family carboxypeptidase